MIESTIPLVSVIVPVYKVEKYLDRAVKSLFKQTYHNLEIILVDDGSPDRCPEMCDLYAQQDSRVKVIHQQNGGLSAARNSALNIASGEYLTFLDSDDYLKENAIEKLVYQLISFKASVACCSIEIVDEYNKSTEYFNCNVQFEDTGINIAKRMLQDFFPKNFAWGKIFRKEIWDNIRFPVGRIYEDSATTFRAVAKADKVICISDCLYCYLRNREGNITSELQSTKAAWSYYCGCINCKEFLIDYSDNKDFTDVIPIIYRNLFIWIKLCMESAIKLGVVGYKDYCRKIDEILSQVKVSLPLRLKIILQFRDLYYYIYPLIGKHR